MNRTSDYISKAFMKSLGAKCIAVRDEKTNELIAITGIDELPSADGQPVVHWIPCSERYPDRSMKTLVTTEWGCERTVEASYWDKDRRWGIITTNVIAWMPLPEPYKKDGEADG